MQYQWKMTTSCLNIKSYSFSTHNPEEEEQQQCNTVFCIPKSPKKWCCKMQANVSRSSLSCSGEAEEAKRRKLKRWRREEKLEAAAQRASSNFFILFQKLLRCINLLKHLHFVAAKKLAQKKKKCRAQSSNSREFYFFFFKKFRKAQKDKNANQQKGIINPVFLWHESAGPGRSFIRYTQEYAQAGFGSVTKIPKLAKSQVKNKLS